MGKKNRATGSTRPTNQSPEIYVAPGNEYRSWLFSLFMLVFVLPAIVTTLACYLGSEPDGRPHFFIRLFLCILLDSVYGGAFYAILLPPARIFARVLPGAQVPSSMAECEEQESDANDASLTWPLPGANIPTEWIDIARSSKREQPFFLNHVRGSTRLRQAILRITAAFGTLSMAYVMSTYVDHTEFSNIGVTISSPDILWGFLVGSSIVIVLFAAELTLGWIHIVGYGEVVVREESLLLNLMWDVLFHVGVSINEEISMRGWILVNTALFMNSMGASASAAMALAVCLQAGMFALMHLGSPGASRVGVINLVFGGAVAALNVFLSGGISFSLGWHFGWNIFMGHLLGLSTSGIPMSAKLVSIVPHPSKESLHGGKFGPEQSPLAASAYVLGCIALVCIYGFDGIKTWRERLS